MVSVSKGYLTQQCWEGYKTKNQILREQIISISKRKCRKFKRTKRTKVWFLMWDGTGMLLMISEFKGAYAVEEVCSLSVRKAPKRQHRA